MVANAHCYGRWGLGYAVYWCKQNADEVVAWADRWGIGEVWVTEFAYDPAWRGMSASVQFMREMVAHYEEIGIDRWAWFQMNSTAGRWSTGELGLHVDGHLTDLGRAYRNLAP